MSTITHHRMPGTEAMPLSSAVQVDNMLYLSGCLGTAPGNPAVVDGGIKPETRQTMENMKAVLEACGSSMDQVVKCTVFLADMAEWAAMNEVYLEYFTTPPARSAVAVAGMARDARVEIECIAVVGD